MRETATARQARRRGRSPPPETRTGSESVLEADLRDTITLTTTTTRHQANSKRMFKKYNATKMLRPSPQRSNESPEEWNHLHQERRLVGIKFAPQLKFLNRRQNHCKLFRQEGGFLVFNSFYLSFFFHPWAQTLETSTSLYSVSSKIKQKRECRLKMTSTGMFKITKRTKVFVSQESTRLTARHTGTLKLFAHKTTPTH